MYYQKEHRISIGQRILLPQEDADPNELIAAAAGVPPADGIYTVSRGDTVSRIADRYNLEESALLAENGIQNPQLIYPGQQIRLPGYADPLSDNQNFGSETPEEEATEIAESQMVAALDSDLIEASNDVSGAPKAEEIAEKENPSEVFQLRKPPPLFKKAPLVCPGSVTRGGAFLKLVAFFT